jgi:ParB family chromosome partitioning protein
VSKIRPGGLGRGLGALIPTAPPPSPVDLPSEPHPSSYQPPVVVYRAAPEIAETTQNADAVERNEDTDRDAVDVQPGLDPVPVLVAAPAPADSPISDGPLPVPGAYFAEIQLARITANPKQPRQIFDDESLSELTHSIREFGMLQPIVVRPRGNDFELIMGERRLRAAEAAGLTEIPAIVRDTADDAMLRDALLENVHRSALNPLEEAAAYQQLLQDFGTTHEELASRLGRSRPQISNTIRLLNLPIPVQRRVAAGVLSAGHARALLGLADRDHQEEIAARIVAEGLSVRATEEIVALAGHARRPVRRTTGPRLISPGLNELAEKLADIFETRVRVDIGKRKGKIVVEFASIDDLERIVATMAPALATRPANSAGPSSPSAS